MQCSWCQRFACCGTRLTHTRAAADSSAVHTLRGQRDVRASRARAVVCGCNMWHILTRHGTNAARCTANFDEMWTKQPALDSPCGTPDAGAPNPFVGCVASSTSVPGGCLRVLLIC
jgi:hypothetical protein